MHHGGFSFFFNDTATTEIYTLSLHDALPICADLPDHDPHQREREPDDHRDRVGDRRRRGGVLRLLDSTAHNRTSVPQMSSLSPSLCRKMTSIISLLDPRSSKHHRSATQGPMT